MEDKNKTTKTTELEGEEALLHRLNVHYSSDEELTEKEKKRATEKGESSASSSRILEEERDDLDFEYYDSDYSGSESESEEEFLSQDDYEYFRLGRVILQMDEERKKLDQSYEAKLEK